MPAIGREHGLGDVTFVLEGKTGIFKLLDKLAAAYPGQLTAAYGRAFVLRAFLGQRGKVGPGLQLGIDGANLVLFLLLHLVGGVAGNQHHDVCEEELTGVGTTAVHLDDVIAELCLDHVRHLARLQGECGFFERIDRAAAADETQIAFVLARPVLAVFLGQSAEVLTGPDTAQYRVGFLPCGSPRLGGACIEADKYVAHLYILFHAVVSLAGQLFVDRRIDEIGFGQLVAIPGQLFLESGCRVNAQGLGFGHLELIVLK